MHATDTLDGRGPSPGTSARVAWFAFGVLFCMTLLDYMDRNVLAAVLPNLTQPRERGGLGLSNEQGGLLFTYFLISYSVVSPLMGWAGDRFRRTRLLFAGVAIWSLATVASGFARSYGDLALARCFLGIGEATYGAIAPTILLDLFPREFRSRLLSLFYLAMPIGAALGIVIGGAIAADFGWHYAFFVVGVPGLLMAFFALTLPDPVRGQSEKADLERLADEEMSGAGPRDYLAVIGNRSFLVATLGMATYTFAIGGLLVWFPKFLIATRGLDQQKATANLGAITCVAAILGMVAGGWLADRLARTRPGALFLVPGAAMLASIPFIMLGLFAKRLDLMYLGIFLAEVLMFVNTGPCNAAIANVVAPKLRAAAYAISIFFIHFLGDIWSPTIIGRLADVYGQPGAMQSASGRLLAKLGATPTLKQGAADGSMENLLAGLLIVLPAVGLSGVILLAGSSFLGRDTKRMLENLGAKPSS